MLYSEKSEDIKRLKGIQEQIHENFINYVKSRRGRRLKKAKDKEIFSGLFWVGQKAVELGLSDGIGHLHETLKNKFGDKTKIKMIEPKKSNYEKHPPKNRLFFLYLMLEHDPHR